MKKESAFKRNFEMVVESKRPKERFSKNVSTQKCSLTLLPEPPPNTFQDLRYDEALASRKGPRLQVWDPVVSVLVKRPTSYQPPVGVAKPFTLGLQLAVDETQQPLELYEPVSRFTRSVVETLKQNKVQQPRCQNAILRKELAKQEHALHAWEDSLKSVNKRTAWLSKKIGRPTAELLLSTPLHLPPPEKHRGTSYGSEHDFPKVKHQDRFYHSDAFFWMPHRVGPAERSIDTSPTWTERKFYKPPLTIARPRLDDTLPTSLKDEKRYQDHGRARATLQKIFVKGAAAVHRCPSSVALLPDDDCGNRKKKPSPHVALSDSVHSKACLMVEDNMYYWGEPCPQDLVEVGFVCLAGERAYNQIRLANLGKTVIRCVWYKTLHSNHFTKGHYRFDHFIFDCSDRILLPWDRVTLKVQFHADDSGFWREVWHLKTVPALGPDGSSPIPISLWARALPVDDNDIRRRELERQLDVLIIKRIVVNYRDQLLRNLPHRDYDTILRERFPVTEDIFVVDDVELFEQANPGLSYHGHAMFTILKLYRKVREFRHPTIEADLVEGVRDVILDKYPRIPQKAEESCKAWKTPKADSWKRTSSFVDTASEGVKAEEVDPRKVRLSRKSEFKKDLIVVQMPSRTHDVPRRTEVDALLDGNPADQDHLERRNINVKGLYNMLGGLDERLEEKNSMLKELNKAVSDMSFHRGQPNVHNFKHLVCRTALCQAADDVAAIAQRVRHDLRLDLRTESFGGVTMSTCSNNNGVMMVTTVQSTSKGEKPDLANLKVNVWQRRLSPSRKRSIVKVKRMSKLRHSDQPGKSVSDTTNDTTRMTSTSEIAPAKSVVTGSDEMYSKLLFVLVYERVERLLLDLLPLMTDDEPQLDPLKPRPEL